MLHSASVHIGRASTDQPFRRHIVVGVDLQDTSLRALQWAINEFARPTGDCIHVVHVDRYQSPQMGIQHSYGASYTIPDLNPMDGDQHADAVKAVLHARFTSLLEQRGLPHVLHLFTDTHNAPASAVADVLFHVAAEAKAVLLVLAAHNKAYGWNDLLLGSVADHCVQHCTVPLMVVRDYQSSPSRPPGSTATSPKAQEAQGPQIQPPTATTTTATTTLQQQGAATIKNNQEAAAAPLQPAQQSVFILRQGSAPISPSGSAAGGAIAVSSPSAAAAASPGAAVAAAGIAGGLARASSLKHPGELRAMRVGPGAAAGGGGGDAGTPSTLVPSTLVIPWSSPATSPLASPTASTMLVRLGMSGPPGGGGSGHA